MHFHYRPARRKTLAARSPGYWDAANKEATTAAAGSTPLGKAAHPTKNPHRNKCRAEVRRHPDNSKYSGYSAKAWYLLADPTDLPVIEVAFLNGQESPTIETADADFGTLGVQMRGYHDFGVNLQDGRLQRVEAISFTWQRGQVVGVS